MANPTLRQKKENTYTVTGKAKKIFQAVYRDQNRSKRRDDDKEYLQVSELVSKMAFYYEKIRNTLDYKEEHLLRKFAIERILKRQVVIEGMISFRSASAEEVAKELLIELIRGRYLPNNEIECEKIKEIAAVITKYLKLRKYSAAKISNFNLKEKNELTNWILALMASDIEERLGRNQVDVRVIEYMYDLLERNLRLPENSQYEEDREIQIFTAIHRNYLKFDAEMLSFILFKYYNGEWQDPELGDEQIAEIANNINSIKAAIDEQLAHPISKQLNRYVSRYTIVFSILTDVIDENPVKVYETIRSDPKAFPRLVKQKTNQRYQEAKSKLWRAAIRSIAYIFITKSVFVVMIEYPAVQFFNEELNVLALLINISFPALLLFLSVLFARMPGEANTAKIVETANEVMFVEHERDDKFTLRPAGKRGPVKSAVFGIFYGLTFLFSSGMVIWALSQIGFNWVSIIIFMFFLLFVSFFSIRIRKNARELMVVEPKENIISLLGGLFYVPIVSAGKWLSQNFSRINVFVFIFDFIIEAPFKIFITIAEEWTRYVKERREDLG